MTALSSSAWSHTIEHDGGTYLVVSDNAYDGSTGLEILCNAATAGDCSGSEDVVLTGYGNLDDGTVFIRDFDVWFEDGEDQIEGLDVEVSGTWNAGTETFTWDYDVHFQGETYVDIGFTLDVVILVGNTSTTDVMSFSNATASCGTAINSSTGCSASNGSVIFTPGGMTALGLPAQRLAFDVANNGTDESIEVERLSFSLNKTQTLAPGVRQYAPECIVEGDNTGSANGITCSFGSVFVAVDTGVIDVLGSVSRSDTGVLNIFQKVDSRTSSDSSYSVFAGVHGLDFEATSPAELDRFGVACQAYAVSDFGREFAHVGILSDASAPITFDADVRCMRAEAQ